MLYHFYSISKERLVQPSMIRFTCGHHLLIGVIYLIGKHFFGVYEQVIVAGGKLREYGIN